MTSEQKALVEELQRQKGHVVLECDRLKRELQEARVQLTAAMRENDQMRQCAQVLVITGQCMLDDTADAEDRHAFAEALFRLLSFGGRRA